MRRQSTACQPFFTNRLFRMNRLAARGSQGKLDRGEQGLRCPIIYLRQFPYGKVYTQPDAQRIESFTASRRGSRQAIGRGDKIWTWPLRQQAVKPRLRTATIEPIGVAPCRT